MIRYELIPHLTELVTLGIDTKEVDEVVVKVLNDLVLHTDRPLNIFIGSDAWRFAGTAIWKGTHQNFYETLYYSEEGEFIE